MRFIAAILLVGLAGALATSATGAGEKMKAVVVHEYGGAEKLKYEDAAVPEPNGSEMLVRVIACGVNPADPLVVSGKYAKDWNTHLPLVPGYEVAGVVEKVGPAVTTFKSGDAVYGYALFGGGWAERAILNEYEAAPKPKSISFVDAAAIPMVALTAWQALVDAGHLSAGQTVLIHGGSGGVGSLAIQIAKARGAKVIATASTRNQDLLKQLGADVTIDYTKQKFEDVAKDVDCVLDPIGEDTLARSYGVVKKGGIVLTLVSQPNAEELKKHGIRGAAIWVTSNGRELAEINKLIEAKKLRPIVTETLPLTDAVKAFTQAETHHTRGKVVLKIADEPTAGN